MDGSNQRDLGFREISISVFFFFRREFIVRLFSWKVENHLLVGSSCKRTNASMFSGVRRNYRVFTCGDLLEEMFAPASHHGEMNFPVRNPVVFLVNAQPDRPETGSELGGRGINF